MSEPLNGKYITKSGLIVLYRNFTRKVIHQSNNPPLWKQLLPTRAELHSSRRFGSPSKDHSNTQTACFETCIYRILTSGYLDLYSFCTVCHTHVLFEHLVKMIIHCMSYDFTWISYEDPYWKQQSDVPQSHARAMLAALFHYRMHAPDVMRFLGGTYTGEHRNINEVVATLTSHNIDPWLITQYVRATTVGCPNHFSAEMSRENAMLHWREGNHPSVKKEIVNVVNTMAKEHRNRFNMPLPNYIAQYIPHLFITPQHALTNPGKTMRLIFMLQNATPPPLHLSTC